MAGKIDPALRVGNRPVTAGFDAQDDGGGSQAGKPKEAPAEGGE